MNNQVRFHPKTTTIDYIKIENILDNSYNLTSHQNT